MNGLMIQPSRPPDSVIRPAPPAVYVDGRRRRDLHARTWSVLGAPEFGKATIDLVMSGRPSPGRRLEDVSALPAVGSRLQIHLPPPARQVLFDGCVTKHCVNIGQDGEQLSLQAEDFLRIRLSRPLFGRWQASTTSPVYLSNGTLTFNDPRDGLASRGHFLVRSRPCRIFQPGPDGRWWSVADILNYLLGAYAGEDLAACGLDDLADPAYWIFPPRLSLTGLPLREGVARVADLAGMSVRGSLCSDASGVRRGVVFYRPGRTGQRRTVHLQPYGEKLDIRRSDLHQGTIFVGSRPGRRGVIVVGGLKRYESTFQLEGAWDPQRESYHYRDFIRGESADWPAVADVFRKWVLNESGWYCGAPYSLPAVDFSTISEDDFLVSAPRRFEKCLSLDKAGHSLGFVVEISCDEGDTWKRYPGPVRLSANECAAYLADDALNADYFQAALARTARLRVTATVASDRRIFGAFVGDPGCPTRLVEMPSAQWATVHSGSIFHGRQDLPAPAERDDTGRLTQIARSLGQSVGQTVEAHLALAWADPTRQVGDIVDQVQGRGLNLATFPSCAPHVSAIEHHCDDQWSTHLTVIG